MSTKVTKIIAPYYCQMALQLCMTARGFCARGNCKKKSETCSFISTLCSKNNFETCSQESAVCSQVAELCLIGKGSEECKKAQELCNEAKILCPRNNQIIGT